VDLADVFCRQARERVHDRFGKIFRNADVPTYRAAQDVLAGKHLWLEEDLPEVAE
jgi:hypothetical protein